MISAKITKGAINWRCSISSDLGKGWWWCRQFYSLFDFTADHIASVRMSRRAPIVFVLRHSAEWKRKEQVNFVIREQTIVFLTFLSRRRRFDRLSHCTMCFRATDTVTRTSWSLLITNSLPMIYQCKTKWVSFVLSVIRHNCVSYRKPANVTVKAQRYFVSECVERDTEAICG